MRSPAGILQRSASRGARACAGATYAELSFVSTSPLVQAGEVSRWRTARTELHRRAARGDAASRRSSRAAGAATRRCEHESAAGAAAARDAARDRRRGRAHRGAAKPVPTALTLLRDPELIDLVTGAPLDADLEAAARREGRRGHRRRRRSASHLKSLRDFDRAAGCCARRVPREPRASAGARQRGVAVPDAGHDRSCVVPARCVDHVVCDQAARGMRAAQPQGVYVGGYGWVENLRPMPTALRRRSRRRRAKPAPLFAPANDTGFIHAPSMTHAAAAALLRNAHLGAAACATSRQVRSRSTCRRAACARRAGCSMACGRGSRSARCSAIASSAACTTSALDRFIAPLRELAPLSARRLENDDSAGRKHRGQQRRRRPGAESEMARCDSRR